MDDDLNTASNAGDQPTEVGNMHCDPVNPRIKYTLRNAHITEVKPGDTVLIDGHLTTVCRNNIKRGPDGDISLFGYLYKGGREPVQVAIIYRAMPE